jgi:hypothetical protein
MKTEKIHKLVAAAFLGSRPSGNDVRHWDGKKQNNHPANLQYGTRKDNERDKVRQGRTNRGERHGRAKLSPENIKEIFRLRRDGAKQVEIGELFEIDQSYVSQILSGRRWGHL